MSDEKTEYYNFVASVDELKWCFDHMIPNLSGNAFQSFLMCIATRPKKLSKEERELYGIAGSDGVMMREEVISARGPKKEWLFDNFMQSLYKYECNKKGMVTKTGLPYPEKSLCVLFHFDPADEVKVANAILSAGHQIQMESIDAQYNAVMNGNTAGMRAQMEKLSQLSRKNKSLHAGVAVKMPDGRRIGTTVKTFVHFDFDIRSDLVDNKEAVDEAYRVLHVCGLNLYGKGNFFIVRTKGGYHVLVKRTALSNAVDIIRSHDKEERESIFGIRGNNYDPIHSYIWYVEDQYSYTFSNSEGDEEKVKEQVFVPMPGCWQYGHEFYPYVANKCDFE